MSHERIKSKIHEYYELSRKNDIPAAARFCFLAAVLYFLWPFDLIPDFIPVFGYLDDLIIVPFLIWLGFRIIDRAKMQNEREKLKHESMGKYYVDHCPEQKE